MKLFLVLLAYVLTRSFVDGQLCTDLPSLSTIESDFRSAVNESSFSLEEIFFNCITYGSPEGSTFRETTITARYQAQDGPFLGQVLYACVDRSGSILWISDTVMLKTGTASNGTERCSNCRELSATTCTGQRIRCSMHIILLFYIFNYAIVLQMFIFANDYVCHYSLS